MRHLQIGRKLGVDAPHRKAMLRTLTLSLIEHETIKTTPARAKELRWYAERVVTLAKRGDVASRRQIVRLLGSTETYTTGQNRVRMAIERLNTELLPRFKNRNGGYTQILKLVKRRAGDNAELCVMRYLPSEEKKEKGGKKEAKKSIGAPSKKKVEAQAEDKKATKVKASSKAEDKAHSHAPEDKPTKAKRKEKE